MTREQVTRKCQLNWSDYAISKSLKRYRIAGPTERFWTLWRSKKQELKALNISVMKDRDFGQYIVYDWGTGGTATRKEKEEFDAREAGACFPHYKEKENEMVLL